MENKDLKKLNDEALVARALKKDEQAEEELLNRYKQLVLTKASKYYIEGGDRDDLVQEGMIALVKAVRSYKEDATASFATFAQVCIDRQLVSAVRNAARKKHSPLNNALSIDQPIAEDSQDAPAIAETLVAGSEAQPEQAALLSELTDMLTDSKAANFSNFEQQVIQYLIKGQSYREIAELLGKTPKQIDNAIQRIRAKLQKLL